MRLVRHAKGYLFPQTVAPRTPLPIQCDNVELSVNPWPEETLDVSVPGLSVKKTLLVVRKRGGGPYRYRCC